MQKMVLKDFNDLKSKQVNDCNTKINEIKCHLSIINMASDKKALRKQCHPFLAGQSTEKEKLRQRKSEYERIICFEI